MWFFRLHVRKYVVNSALYLDLLQNMRYLPARYPFKRIVMREYEISQGRTDSHYALVTAGTLPIAVLLLPVSTKRRRGGKTLNPFKVCHPRVKACVLTSHVSHHVLGANFWVG